jgi:hypothetical protein
MAIANRLIGADPDSGVAVSAAPERGDLCGYAHGCHG